MDLLPKYSRLIIKHPQNTGVYRKVDEFLDLKTKRLSKEGFR